MTGNQFDEFSRIPVRTERAKSDEERQEYVEAEKRRWNCFQERDSEISQNPIIV